MSANLQLGPDLVRVSAIPPGDRRTQLSLSVLGHRDRPVEPTQVSAKVSLRTENIRPLTPPVSAVDEDSTTVTLRIR